MLLFYSSKRESNESKCYTKLTLPICNFDLIGNFIMTSTFAIT